MSSTGVSSLRLGPMCLLQAKDLDGQEWSPAQDGVQDADHSHSAGLESLGRGRVIPSFCRALPLTHFSATSTFRLFLFCILSAWFALCLFECSQDVACMSRKRGVQLLNYGGGFKNRDLRLLCGYHGWRCFEQHTCTSWRVGTFLVLTEAEALSF